VGLEKTLKLHEESSKQLPRLATQIVSVESHVYDLATAHLPVLT
jgi:hypothetical protein